MYDVVIVGAGPAGLTAGIYTRTKRLSSMILEAQRVGGQLSCLYPYKTIHDYPSYTEVKAKELVHKMAEQVRELGCEIREGEEVTDLVVEEEKVTVKTQKNAYEAKAAILAVGMGLFEPMKLGVAGEDQFAGKGIDYCVLDPEDFRGKELLFVGGGDTALEMALTVCDIAKSLTLIHRRDSFRADEMTVEQVMKSSIKVLFTTELKDIIGENSPEKVRLLNNVTNEETVLPIERIVINIGFKPNVEAIKGWGLEMQGPAIVVNTEMRTNLKGVFACGDIATYEGKIKRITTACGEATTAVNSAYKYIRKPYWA